MKTTELFEAKAPKEGATHEFIMGGEEGNPRKTVGTAAEVCAKLLRVFKRDVKDTDDKETTEKFKAALPKWEAMTDPVKLFKALVHSDLAWDGYDLEVNVLGKKSKQPSATRY